MQVHFASEHKGQNPERSLAKVKVKSLSRLRLLATPWTVACQALLSVEFFRPEYWSG